ncbi:MAG: valine--tRNA ligase, partial [Lactobacillus iners]|nr:valine--tRNA ligase [Lactobacillus iners]
MTELAPKYDPRAVEEGRYQTWLDEDLFKPSGDKKAHPYSIVIPPPNVTGKLHLGHAWDTSIQDTLIRFKRMQGYDTLYLPGMDHAGIATQAKVEEKLRKQGQDRHQLGREKFIKQVWDWKDEYASIIKSQWGKMGLSLDYSRERFTLDDGLSKAVRKVFVKLYEEGLIYRGQYIINWDPKLETALSDIEVIHKDDNGAFYHINYPLADGTGSVEIATTRPETMFGDTAVAVAPGDERYKDLVGKELILPLVGRHIPVIEDQHVDPDFGTGLVKITPAHDPNDFLVGNRHNLQRINVMNDDGTMNEQAGKYAGMDRFDCRKALVEDLKNEGYLLKIEPIVHSVGHSERSGVQIEPRLSTQWFVKMKPLADKVLSNQKEDDKVNFVPERFEGTLEHWMENVHDWVISRQLWWGHRIPAWYNKKTGEMVVQEEAPKDIENWDQDNDVLDTWFSSALWPFSTLGWPDEEAADFKRYFPTNALVTGYDIIFFWVSRMIFQSLHFTKRRPFENVVLHGLIRDEQGRKMSKSLGNGIDPMDVVEKYGADSLRWFLLNGTAPGQDTRFSYTKMDSAWNFINKIWNASRFVIMNLPEDAAAAHMPDVDTFDLSDKWIFDKLNRVVKKVTRLFDEFQFGEAGREMYNFIWNDFCDWYIEISKVALNGTDEILKKHKQDNLVWILDQILRLIHPIMPFVTEKLWLSMPHNGKSIMVASYPVEHPEFENHVAEQDMEFLIEIIKAVR